MIERVIIAGAGGQGVMLLGKVLAQAAMHQGKFVTWFPAYGPEVRGGTSHCMVIISDRQIGSPHIHKADSVIILNHPSWERFKTRVNDDGLLVFNTSLVKSAEKSKAKTCGFSFTDIAIKLGNIKVANMVALGCYLGVKKIVEVPAMREVFKSLAPAGNTHILEINNQALEEGVKLVNGKG